MSFQKLLKKFSESAGAIIAGSILAARALAPLDQIVGGHAEGGRALRLWSAGCACGDGVIDWKKVIQICRRAKRDIVLSVECGTIEQAERSIQHLKQFA